LCFYDLSHCHFHNQFNQQLAVAVQSCQGLRVEFSARSEAEVRALYNLQKHHPAYAAFTQYLQSVRQCVALDNHESGMQVPNLIGTWDGKLITFLFVCLLLIWFADLA
jgi:hypothetical protein